MLLFSFFKNCSYFQQGFCFFCLQIFFFFQLLFFSPLQSFETQMFVCSVFHWAGGLSTHSFISVGGCWVVTGCICQAAGLALGAESLWPCSSILSSLCTVAATLFDLFIFLKIDALYLFSIHAAAQQQQRSFPHLHPLHIDCKPITYWPVVVLCSAAVWKENTAPLQYRGKAVLFLCRKNILEGNVVAAAWCGAGPDWTKLWERGWAEERWKWTYSFFVFV